jgi:acetylornithine deacetylase/succinyl-diaminopimelate desuccinylase-like protein
MKFKTRDRYSYLIILFVIAVILFCQNYLYQRYQSYDRKPDVVDDTRQSGEYAYNHVRVLASPEYEGRAPGTKGGQLAAQYIAGQFQAIGLKPAGDQGTYFQTIKSPEFSLVLVANRWVPRLTRGMFLAVPSDNVLSYLASGGAPFPADTIIISAHYDHLGKFGDSYFPGANDNASGIGVMLETARILASRQQKPKYNILFAAWTSEEEGLYGSRWFTEKSPTNGIRAVINLDTVGNGDLRDFRIWTQTQNNSLVGIIKDEGAKQGLSIDTEVLGKSPPHTSDQRSFAEVGIPAVTLLTPDWLDKNHSVQDTPAIVEPVKLGNAVRLVIAAIDRLTD